MRIGSLDFAFIICVVSFPAGSCDPRALFGLSERCARQRGPVEFGVAARLCARGTARQCAVHDENRMAGTGRRVGRDTPMPPCIGPVFVELRILAGDLVCDRFVCRCYIEQIPDPTDGECARSTANPSTVLLSLFGRSSTRTAAPSRSSRRSRLAPRCPFAPVSRIKRKSPFRQPEQ